MIWMSWCTFSVLEVVEEMVEEVVEEVFEKVVDEALRGFGG
jgi:hypothetical protein